MEAIKLVTNAPPLIANITLNFRFEISCLASIPSIEAKNAKVASMKSPLAKIQRDAQAIPTPRTI